MSYITLFINIWVVHVQWIFEVYAICACFIYYYDQYSFTNWGSITELHVYIVYKDIAYRKNNKSSFSLDLIYKE